MKLRLPEGQEEVTGQLAFRDFFRKLRLHAKEEEQKEDQGEETKERPPSFSFTTTRYSLTRVDRVA